MKIGTKNYEQQAVEYLEFGGKVNVEAEEHWFKNDKISVTMDLKLRAVTFKFGQIPLISASVDPIKLMDEFSWTVGIEKEIIYKGYSPSVDRLRLDYHHEF